MPKRQKKKSAEKSNLQCNARKKIVSNRSGKVKKTNIKNLKNYGPLK